MSRSPNTPSSTPEVARVSIRRRLELKPSRPSAHVRPRWHLHRTADEQDDRKRSHPTRPRRTRALRDYRIRHYLADLPRASLLALVFRLRSRRRRRQRQRRLRLWRQRRLERRLLTRAAFSRSERAKDTQSNDSPHASASKSRALRALQARTSYAAPLRAIEASPRYSTCCTHGVARRLLLKSTRSLGEKAAPQHNITAISNREGVVSPHSPDGPASVCSLAALVAMIFVSARGLADERISHEGRGRETQKGVSLPPCSVAIQTQRNPLRSKRVAKVNVEAAALRRFAVVDVDDRRLNPRNAEASTERYAKIGKTRVADARIASACVDKRYDHESKTQSERTEVHERVAKLGVGERCSVTDKAVLFEAAERCTAAEPSSAKALAGVAASSPKVQVEQPNMRARRFPMAKAYGTSAATVSTVVRCSRRRLTSKGTKARENIRHDKKSVSSLRRTPRRPRRHLRPLCRPPDPRLSRQARTRSAAPREE